MILRKGTSNLFMWCLLLVSGIVFAQVKQKIGGNSTKISSSAILELESTTRGFLLPRMTYAQRAAIVAPVPGLQIWCIDCGTSGEMQLYDGGIWLSASVYVPPVVTTNAVTSIAASTATAGGAITSNGSTITSRGVCYTSSGAIPTVDDSKTTEAGTTGSFASALSGLADAKFYYLRAYATVGSSTTYGNLVSFTTQSVAVATTAISSVTNATASSGGSVSNDGGVTILARGVCYNTASAPTINNTKTSDAATSIYTSALSGLTAATMYYARAYVTTNGGTVYGSEVTFTTLSTPSLATAAVTNIATTNATSGGTINNDTGWTISSRGVCYSMTSAPTIINSKTTDSATNPYTSSLNGLSANTLYYVRAYATTNGGSTFYGNQVTFTTPNVTNQVGGNAICDGSRTTVVVELPNSVNNKIWMDRNIGASQAATSPSDFLAYGCLYQWGRGNDGHASMTWAGINGGTPVNTTSNTQSSSDTPGNLFIIGFSDWRNPQKDGLWQAVSQVNNPCNAGYRVPTDAEITSEFGSYGITNSTTAFSNGPTGGNGLKFVMAGLRASTNGSVNSGGTGGFYWSSTVTGASAFYRYISGSSTYSSTTGRGWGHSVRCIKQ